MGLTLSIESSGLGHHFIGHCRKHSIKFMLLPSLSEHLLAGMNQGLFACEGWMWKEAVSFPLPWQGEQWGCQSFFQSLEGLSAAFTWCKETKRGPLDQQLRPNNSCRATLRGCGRAYPVSRSPPPCFVLHPACRGAWYSDNQQALGPDSQIIQELERLLCKGRPWGLFQLEQLQDPETKAE